MSHEPKNDSIIRQLHTLFPLSSGANLNELRAPAGSFVVAEISPLIDRGMVEFDTRTGIACQGVGDWALQLTTEGIQCLRATERDGLLRG